MHNPSIAWKLKWTEARRTQVKTVYEQVLGKRFLHLPGTIQLLHGRRNHVCGRVDVKRGKHWLAKLLNHWLGLPADGEHQPLDIRFERYADAEIWRRSFAGHLFMSRQFVKDGLLHEQLGPLRLAFALSTDGQTLDLKIMRSWLFGIPIPRALAPTLAAQEWSLAGGVGFSVNVTLPVVGLLIHYAGSVRPPTHSFDHTD